MVDQNLFEHDMLFVSSNQINLENIQKNIEREENEKPKEVATLQIGFGRELEFLEVVVPIRFKIPNYTQLNQLVKVYLELVKEKIKRANQEGKKSGRKISQWLNR